MIVVSTAHWAKFGEDVYRALTGIRYRDPLPYEAAALSRKELLEEITCLAPGQVVPASIATLDRLEREPPVQIGTSTGEAVEAIGTWLDRIGTG